MFRERFVTGFARKARTVTAFDRENRHVDGPVISGGRLAGRAVAPRFPLRIRPDPQPVDSLGVVVVVSPQAGPAHPATRSRAVADSPSLMMLVLVAAIGVLIYSVFVFDVSHRGDWPAYLMVLLAESVIILQSLLSLWTILSSGHDPRDYVFNAAQQALFGAAAEETQTIGMVGGVASTPLHLDGWPVEVDVFVTTYGEDPATVRRTVAAAMAMRGAHTTWVLDDGGSAEVRAIAAELGAEYIAREGNAHAKAGNVNNALSVTRGEYFAIFDADFVADPRFLTETVPFFADPTVAFVQTPQVYGNLHSLVSRGAGYMQSVFYRFTQPGKNRFNAAFCVGTNVIFRRTAIDEIGGIHQESKSEDVWTSLKLHERGWRSIYIATELAVGHTPETIESYTKQQLRWATGGFEILFRSNPMGRARTLTVDQRLQYFGTATFYLVGIAPMLLILVPPLQIYFGLSPISSDVPVLTWLLYYAGFYFMQIVVALYTIGSFRWETLMLATASFPIYAKAFVNALLRRDQGWSVTGRVGQRVSPFTFIVPQVLVFVFLLLTSAVGLWQNWLDRTFTLAVFWNLLNTAVLGAFVVTAMRESGRNRRRPAAPVAVTPAAPLAPSVAGRRSPPVRRGRLPQPPVAAPAAATHRRAVPEPSGTERMRPVPPRPVPLPPVPVPGPVRPVPSQPVPSRPAPPRHARTVRPYAIPQQPDPQRPDPLPPAPIRPGPERGTRPAHAPAAPDPAERPLGRRLVPAPRSPSGPNGHHGLGGPR
jgi:cellulose synthase (UDP-forming)